MIIPSHGLTHAVYLLAHTARLTDPGDGADLVRRAREYGTFLSAATDLDAVVGKLIEHGLVETRERLRVDERLVAIAQQQTGRALREIARILLLADAPIWLYTAVESGTVMREYLPSQVLRSMRWLEPDLDQVILDAHSELQERLDPAYRKTLGDAAEQMILAALRYAGREPIHLAAISDRFGYDIEVPGVPVDRIEVKAASERTRGRFHLTRNEFEKSRLYGPEWRLVQVVFNGGAFVASRIDSSHVVCVLQLASGALDEAVPSDTPAFKWTESAIVAPNPSAWGSAKLSLDPGFSLPVLQRPFML